MKSVVKECKVNQEIEYPCLMKGEDTEQIVLFSELGIGIVVDQGKSGRVLSDFSTNWYMNEFTLFDGSVTLSNS